MFVRAKRRFKDGKEHRYFSVVENCRNRDGRVVQRQVLYLGEINDSQRAAWCRSIEVLQGDSGSVPMALLADDRVPVLDDGDVCIFESGAIVEYVLARYGNGAMKPGVDDPEFPSYLQWFHYCEGMVMPPVNTIVVHTLLLPPERRDEVVLGQAQRLVGKALPPVDEALEGKDYLIGDLSGADIMLGHASFMCGRLGLISEDMPNLKGYVDRIAKRPAFQKAMAS